MPKGLLAGLSLLWAAACSSSMQPKLAPCTAASAGQVSLAVAAYAAVDPTQSAGCAVFGPNTSASAYQYLLVPQAAGGVPDDSSAFLLRGATVPAAAAPFAASLRRPAQAIPIQQQFDLTLRRAERELASRVGALNRPRAAAPVARVPPAVGDRRVFKVCGNSDCTTHPTVIAFARNVGTHIAVFQMTLTTKADLAALREALLSFRFLTH